MAREFVDRGYLRLNRDETGGTLRALVPALDRALGSGTSRIVLDNTYVSRASRAAVIQASAARGVAVRCVWLSTSVADAQVNAVSRIVERYGKLLDVDELASHRKRDPAALPPMTQFRYQRELEAPDVAEGFARVDIVPFERRTDPSFTERAVLIWCDGILVRSQSNQRVPSSVDDLVVDAGRAAALRRYAEDGFRLLGLSWQPEIAEGKRTAADVDAVFAKVNELLGLAIEVEVLHARRWSAAVLVPQASTGTWRAADSSSPSRSGALHLRRRWTTGRRLRAALGVRVPSCTRILRRLLGAQALRYCLRAGRKPCATSPDEPWRRPAATPAPSCALGQKSVKSQALLCRVHPAMARWVPSGDGIAVTGVP